METKQKEVWFNLYCKSCKDAKTHEFDDPCNECLGYPANEDSHKPVNYRWNGEGEEPKFDSTDERKSHG